MGHEAHRGFSWVVDAAADAVTASNIPRRTPDDYEVFFLGELALAVNDAYALSGEEVELLWDTAPPRMPGKRPG